MSGFNRVCIHRDGEHEGGSCIAAYFRPSTNDCQSVSTSSSFDTCLEAGAVQSMDLAGIALSPPSACAGATGGAPGGDIHAEGPVTLCCNL